VKGGREAHLGVADVLAGQLVGKLVGDQLVVRGDAQTAADRALDLGEVREVAEAEPQAKLLQVRARQVDCVALVQGEHGARADGPLQMEVKLGLGCRTQVARAGHCSALAEFYQLQSAFHHAKTMQDLDRMMSLWPEGLRMDSVGDPNSPSGPKA
jgi:hypothetical protein